RPRKARLHPRLRSLSASISFPGRTHAERRAFFFGRTQKIEFQSGPVATPNPATDGRPVRIRRGIAIGIGASLLGLAATNAATPVLNPTDWQKTVSPISRGDFPNPRPLAATYEFGWTGLAAATGEVQFVRQGEKLQITATGQTIGVVRGLWKFNTHHR